MGDGAGIPERLHEVVRKRRAWLDRQLNAASGVSVLSSDWTGTAVSVLLAVTLLLAVASVTFAVSQPAEQYSEFYLLTDDETGTLDASDYPRNLTRGESAPLVIGISNHEQTQVRYTVVVEFQRVRVTDGTNVTVIEQREGQRIDATLEPGETRHLPYELTPPIAGEELRVRFFLFKGDPPANPDAADAYRELHLWVNVSASDGS